MYVCKNIVGNQYIIGCCVHCYDDLLSDALLSQGASGVSCALMIDRFFLIHFSHANQSRL